VPCWPDQACAAWLALHCTGQAAAECTCGGLQRQAAGMNACEPLFSSVRQTSACWPGGDRTIIMCGCNRPSWALPGAGQPALVLACGKPAFSAAARSPAVRVDSVLRATARRKLAGAEKRRLIEQKHRQGEPCGDRALLLSGGKLGLRSAEVDILSPLQRRRIRARRGREHYGPRLTQKVAKSASSRVGEAYRRASSGP
jgi:hypothetical protein